MQTPSPLADGQQVRVTSPAYGGAVATVRPRTDFIPGFPGFVGVIVDGEQQRNVRLNPNGYGWEHLPA
ncbi:MAG TPA: hypothetical protein VE053_06865 [Allosphingosinicella sp.]|nr:hypothetical protein [Allosphingosinicella sp.]